MLGWAPCQVLANKMRFQNRCKKAYILGNYCWSVRVKGMNLLKQLKSSRNILNLPNVLTLFRILLVPIVAVLLSFESNDLERTWGSGITPGRLAALVVLLAGLTDFFDGYFARVWHIESLLGKFLDPVADKLFIMVGLIMLMQLDRVPDWLVILLLSREMLITALRGVAAGEGIIISAGQPGKWKLVLQLNGVGFLMWHGDIFGTGVRAYPIGLVILYAALVISLFSGWRYLNDFFLALRRQKEGRAA